MSKQVLVIDDDAHVLRIIKLNLAADGFRVVTAQNPEEGLALAGQSPDLIILDVMMPGLTGLGLARRLSGDPRTGAIPLLFLSARAQDEDELRGLEAGGDLYVTKPFSPAALSAAVARLLAMPAEERLARRRALAASLAKTINSRAAEHGEEAALEPPLHRELFEGCPVKFGCVLPVRGPFAGLGEPERLGLELGIARINASGGILGHPVQLVVLDDQGDPSLTPVMMRRLIEEEKVTAIIGCATTLTSQAGAPVAEAAGVPLMLLTGNRSVWEHTGYIFQSTPSTEVDAAALLNYMEHIGVHGFSVCWAQTPYGREGAELLYGGAFGRGMAVVHSESYGQLDQEFGALAAQVARSCPEAVVIWGSTAAGALLLRQLRAAGVTVPVLVCYVLVTRTFVEVAGVAGQGVIGHTSLSFDRSDPVRQDFIDAYRSRYQVAPTSPAVWGYDAAYLFRRAIQAAGSLEPDRIAACMLQTRGFRGVVGEYTITPSDHHGLGPESLTPITLRNGWWQDVLLPQPVRGS